MGGLSAKYPDYFTAASEQDDEVNEEEKTGASDAFNDNIAKFNDEWFWYRIFYTFKGNARDEYHEIEKWNYNDVFTHLSFLSRLNKLESKK